MPGSHDTTFRVFYSWQSDLPNAVNLKLIRNALNDAASVINSDHDFNLHVIIDEATREVPGSPNIADSIFKKIRESDVFVCDLTKVAELSNAAGDMRKYCNPNVAIELGYAVRVLGWSRIIIVFNEAYGDITNDLPFDARGHRTSLYRCYAEQDDAGKPTAACQSQISNTSGSLRKIFIDALKLVARENPKRPHDLEAKAPEIIRRERDVEQLNKVFYWIHLGIMDEFIDRLAKQCRLTHVGSDFSMELSNVMNGSSFHINDVELRTKIVAFAEAWNRCSTYADEMEECSNRQESYFHLPGDIFISKEQEDHHRFTWKQAQPLREALDKLLNYVRQHYLEIDPTVCGKDALRKHEEFRKKLKVDLESRT